MDNHQFICNKDLARELCFSVDTLKRWSRRLGIQPTIPGHAAHRWTRKDADHFVECIRQFWQKRQSRKRPPSP